MKICDFVRGILQELNQLPPDVEAQPTRDKIKNYLLVKTEGQLAVKQLHDFLNSHASLQGELNESSLSKFKIFLRDRWLAIKGTDAIYPHSPYSLPNRSYSVLAKHISNYTEELVLNLLMPGKWPFNNNYKKRGVNYELRPQDFIFRDDGPPLIIMLALDNMCREGFSNSADSLIKSRQSKSLSDEEIRRCAFHSPACANYYAAIVAKCPSDELKEVRKKCEDELKSDYYQVNSSYGIKGQELLLAMLLNNITTQAELIDFFADFVPKKYWAIFISLIDDQFFFKVLLGIECSNKLTQETLKVILEKLIIEMGNPRGGKHNELALVFCLLEAYERHATAFSGYNTIWGAWVGKSMPSMTGSYSKEEKIKACKGLKKLIITNTLVVEQFAGPLNSGTLRQLRDRVAQCMGLSSVMQASLPTATEKSIPIPAFKS